MVAVKIPGAESIDPVAPARDPGVTASPDAFGAQIGTSEVHFGDALDSLGAHLYRKQQAATDQVAEQTYNVGVAPRLQQNEIDARKAYPDGGAEYIAASQAGSVKAHNDTINEMAARGITPSSSAFQRIGTTFSGYDMNARVGAVTYNNNAGVAKLQSALDDNNNLVASNVLAGKQSLKDGLATIPGNVEAGKSLYGGEAMRKKEEAWQQAIVDAALRNRLDAGDAAGYKALKDKYYGSTPRAGSVSIFDAIYGQESGSGRNTQTSVTGARGGMQIQPETFKQYAVPGESIDSKADNLAVGQRIIDDLSRRSGGDPARIAVGYFSGPGNIAPPGSPTPWIKDKTDPTGKSTSSYVSDILRRTGGQAPINPKNPDGSTPEMPNVTKALYWDGQERHAETDIKRTDLIEKAKAQHINDKAEEEYIAGTMNGDPKMTAVAASNDPRLNKAGRMQMISFIERQNKPDPLARVSQATATGLLERMRLPEGDPNKVTDLGPVYDAYTKDQKLTRADFDFLQRQFKEGASDSGNKLSEKKKSFVNDAKVAIGIHNINEQMSAGAGTFAQYNFERDLERRIDAYREAKKDPMNLFDPLSPDFLGKTGPDGKPLILKPYTRTLQEIARDKAEAAKAAAAPPAKPVADMAAERKRLDEFLKTRGGAPTASAPASPPYSDQSVRANANR